MCFSRDGVPASRPRGGSDRPSAGHHAECGGPMDTQVRSSYIRGPEEWMSVTHKIKTSRMHIRGLCKKTQQSVEDSDKGLKTTGQWVVSMLIRGKLSKNHKSR